MDAEQREIYESECPHCGERNVVSCRTYGTRECEIRCEGCGYIYIMEIDHTDEENWTLVEVEEGESKGLVSKESSFTTSPKSKRKRAYELRHYAIMTMLMTAFVLGLIYATTLFGVVGYHAEGSVENRGKIFGSIFDENGMAVENAEVFVDHEDSEPLAITDRNGYFFIENVPEGDHTVYVYVNGKRALTGDIYVEGGKTSVMEITHAKNGGDVYYSSDIKEPTLRLSNMNTLLGTVVLISSFACLIAFFSVYFMRYYYLGVIAAFVGAFSFGFYLGMALAIAAFALIILSKEEFE